MTNQHDENLEKDASQVLADDNTQVEARMKAMSRRSFLWGALAVGSGVGGLRWLNSRPREDGLVWPLRRMLQSNESLNRNFFSASRLAPTFSIAQIEPIRTNGMYGLSEDFDASQWKLNVEGLADKATTTAQFTLSQIQQLPVADIITELKCIEGWARINRWTGVRLRDFIARYPPATISGAPFDLDKPEDWPAYVSLSTPDGGYYVGLEMEAALHPQTLLCYAMNGAPLKPENGAPLRLAIPVKYGIKNLKRIGTISYTNQRPPDFWAERGYDYHAGH